MESIKQLSEQQTAVIDWSRNDTGSLILIARAGCGKSSTAIELVKDLASRRATVSIFIGAYNKAIAAEFTAKLAAAEINWKNASAKTFHAAGFNAWQKVAPEVKIEDKKLAKIFEAELATRSEEVKARMEVIRVQVMKAVSIAKQRAFGVLCAIDDASRWYDIVDHFSLDEDLPEDVDMELFVKTAVWLYKSSLKSCREMIDFDDMILAPLYYKAKFWLHDWVIIDEAQDTNPSRRALALRMLKPGGRLVAIGDPAQAIYGFTGADADSMELLRAATNAKTLPLTLTYRCPQVAVKRVQKWVPDITAHASNMEGVERSIYLRSIGTERPTVEGETFTADDAILCRNTKPIVELAYSLLRRGVACQVEGREIATGLLKLVNRWKLANIAPMLIKLAEYRDKEVAKYMAKGKEQKAEEIADRCETIFVLAEKCLAEKKTALSDLETFINSMFGDTPAGSKPKCLTLATVHKSKGREWKRVYILGQSKYMPSRYARKAWQAEQEINLMYVAGTRAKEEIVDIIDDEV